MKLRNTTFKQIKFTHEHRYNKLNSNPDKNYYVYLHVDPMTDEIFYVGKGSWNRAIEHTKRSERNPKWFTRSQENGIKVILIADQLTNSQARILESETIWDLKDSNLTNTHGMNVMPYSYFQLKLQELINNIDSLTPLQEEWLKDIYTDPKCSPSNTDIITDHFKLPRRRTGGRAKGIFVYCRESGNYLTFCGGIKITAEEFLGSYGKKNHVIYNYDKDYYFSRIDHGSNCPQKIMNTNK